MPKVVASIVAWLRGKSEHVSLRSAISNDHARRLDGMEQAYDNAADAIERGEYRDMSGLSQCETGRDKNDITGGDDERG